MVYFRISVKCVNCVWSSCTYEYNYMFHNSPTVSNLFLFLILWIHFSVFQCSTHQPTSAAEFEWNVNNLKRTISCLQNQYFLNFGFTGFGRGLQSGSTPSPWVPPCCYYTALHIFAQATAYSELELLTSARGLIDMKIPPSALLSKAKIHLKTVDLNLNLSTVDIWHSSVISHEAFPLIFVFMLWHSPLMATVVSSIYF